MKTLAFVLILMEGLYYRLNFAAARERHIVKIISMVDVRHSSPSASLIFSVSLSPCTPKALSLGVERQILGVKINTLFIHMWHAYSKRLDAALKKHDALV